MVKTSVSKTTDPGLNPRFLRVDFFSGRVILVTSKLVTPVAIPCQAPGVIRISAGTGRPGVSILRLGETESSICNFYLSVAARAIV